MLWLFGANTGAYWAVDRGGVAGSMRIYAPLYDMTYTVCPYVGGDTIDRFLSVSNSVNVEDRRHTLGVPIWLSTKDAVDTARYRGWKVAGLWKEKTA